MIKRCAWVRDESIHIKYHDEEWGRQCFDDYKLFEHLILDSHQAGLSWKTILDKRENYRKAFDGFDPRKISNYDDDKINELMQDKGIIRNRPKIQSSIVNAKLFFELEKEFGSFSSYIWSFVKGKTIINAWSKPCSIPTQEEHSINMSKDMKRRGFGFVGPVSLYAFMQAVGMVLDHTTDCFVYEELANKAKEQ